ncbi:MAG: DoxX family protein [Bacteroidetes bacterium]|nr:DoxX family protein [Bacteroidota bacterium]
MALLDSLSKYRNTGLLIIRIGLGILFMFHGYPKLLGGPEQWEAIGGAMKNLGITFAPAVWGLIAGLTETFGGFLILLGLAFRPVCVLLTFNLMVAALMHLKAGEDFMAASQAIETGCMFFGLLFIGPGKYSVDKK